MIYAIYKSGPKHDFSNYLAITLTSCWGKLFSTLFNDKFENKVEKKNYSPNRKQASEKSYRTADHIITLFTLIEKSKRE